LQGVGSLTFHPTEHESIICFSKRTPDRSNIVVVVVNLDPFQRHWTYVNLNLAELGIGADETYEVFDTLSGEGYVWRGAWNYVELDPAWRPAHILVLKRYAGPLGTGQ
jgi:starch synthase (maltosyl-transferring)